MKRVALPGGEEVPALGMGTWMIGEDAARRSEEISTLQQGIDLGMALIDTAEMYGDGASEKLVGQAIRGRRDRVFLVSKVYPHNAGYKAAQAACERSLKRLGVDCLDLYLLHWRGDVPFTETIEAFVALQAQGKIRHWGVSNFDLDDLQAWCDLPGGDAVATNQVLYNLTRRGVEWDVLPWCQTRRIPLMAYSPIEQSRLLDHRAFCALARQHGFTPAQLAIAWLLRQDRVIAIPKASTRQHLTENFSALNCTLDATVLAALDRLFPPPEHATALEML